MREIILASASPQRKKILELINLDFKIHKSNFDESRIEIDNNNPNTYCLNLAAKKAKDVSMIFPESIVIGADTIVYHENTILGKPQNKSEALKHLNSLNNSCHIVYSAVSINIESLGIKETIIDQTTVTFNKISLDDINYYIDNFNPYERAGSYGIQDWSSLFVKKINGCYYNVVGFPLSKFYILFNKIKNK